MRQQRSVESCAEQPFEVRSPDGTPIAVWEDGAGAPLVLVHGSLRDHRIFEPLIEELRPYVTTFALDRRGFGASGDTAPYALERDLEDLAVVVDAVAERCGTPVALFGHSYGAGCALGAAARSAHVAALVVYEPGLGIAYPPGWIEAQEARLAGDVDCVVVAVLRDILELTDVEIDALRADTGRWAELLAAAPTVLREARVEDGWTYPRGMLDGISAPTLFLQGSQTPPALAACTAAAAALVPGACVHVLEGHAHLAHQTDPAMVAALVREVMA